MISTYQAALLEPEDRTETSREEDAFDCRKCNKALTEAAIGSNPFHCPVCLLLDTRDSLDGVEKLVLLFGVTNVGIDQQTVGFGVDVLHRHLESVETTRFRKLNLVDEAGTKVFQNDSITVDKVRD